MKNETSDIFDKLNKIARKHVAKATYKEVIETLLKNRPSGLSRHQALLASSRVMRDAELLNADQAFFIMSWSVEALAEEQIQEAYRRDFSERSEVLRKQYGLASDEYWPRGEEPLEDQALSTEFEQVVDDITYETFCHYGESETANLYRNDRDEFDRRREAGRRQMRPLPAPGDLLGRREGNGQ